MSKSLNAVVLAGGYGTRMFPLTLRTPKPLLPVAGKPVLQHIIELLVDAGIQNITISLKENQHNIETYFGNGKAFNARMTYAYEKAVSETGKMGSVGALSYVFSKHCSPSDCLVIGADNFFYGLDLKGMRSTHTSKKAHATLALFDLQHVEDVRLFGVAELFDDGKIRGFQEKPSVEDAASKLASTAIYQLEEAFIRTHLPRYVKMQHEKGKKADRIGDLWNHFVDELNLVGYPFKGIWGDIGNTQNYLETNASAMKFLHKKGGHRMDARASIDRSAVIKAPVIIEKGVQVRSGAIIGPNACILHDSIVDEGASIENAIVFERVRVGKKAMVCNAVVDGGVHIGNQSEVSGYSMLGFESQIGHHTRVIGNTRIYPRITVPDDVEITKDQTASDEPIMKTLEDSCYWR
ncbi:NDP-sugar synthase [Candidatus Micrarchaeota archaeon]|nr:NDP-sugar synthase [Candidatus Micrarchaeota archaeon]